MTDIVMPKLSDSMEQGTILSWLKAAGDQVEEGDELLEVETDKATVTYQAQTAGVLEIIAAEGSTMAVGEVIARLRISAPTSEHTEPEAPVVQAAGPVPPAAASGTEMAVGSSEVAPPAGTQAPTRDNGRRRSHATPLARRTAALHGVALEEIAGTGPLGRITRTDVLRMVGAAPAGTGTTRQELSRLQQLIARRMSESKATVPHFQVQTEVAMDAAIEFRSQLKRAAAAHGEPVPSVNDIIIKAVALALRDHPLANGSYKDGAYELHDAINIGVAVASDDALVVPIVFDAPRKTLGQIAQETRALGARVRSGEITPPELSGGTFTVSNLGMFGMTAITPVINPPQAAILGVGAIRNTLARNGGEISDRALLTLTLSCDHRILYGADAARFLAQIRELLETPLSLVL